MVSSVCWFHHVSLGLGGAAEPRCDHQQRLPQHELADAMGLLLFVVLCFCLLRARATCTCYACTRVFAHSLLLQICRHRDNGADWSLGLDERAWFLTASNKSRCSEPPAVGRLQCATATWARKQPIHSCKTIASLEGANEAIGAKVQLFQRRVTTRYMNKKELQR